jgi:hypothetical protein
MEAVARRHAGWQKAACAEHALAATKLGWSAEQASAVQNGVKHVTGRLTTIGSIGALWHQDW